MLLLSLKTRVMLKLQFMVVMDTTMMATDCGGISSRWKRPFVFDRSSSYSSGGRRGASKRSDYRIMVTGLPSSASWQDLKDHMRRAGDACFSDGYHEAGATIGIVDYTNYEDMKHAIRKLDDSEFRNAFSQAYIRGWEFDARRSRSHSRGRSRSRSN